MQHDAPEPTNNTGVYARIEQRLERIEDKLDARMDAMAVKVDIVDGKVDGVTSRQDRLEGKLEGSLGMIKWLGPVGLAAIVYGLLTVYGLIPFGSGT